MFVAHLICAACVYVCVHTCGWVREHSYKEMKKNGNPYNQFRAVLMVFLHLYSSTPSILAWDIIRTTHKKPSSLLFSIARNVPILPRVRWLDFLVWWRFFSWFHSCCHNIHHPPLLRPTFFFGGWVLHIPSCERCLYNLSKVYLYKSLSVFVCSKSNYHLLYPYKSILFPQLFLPGAFEVACILATISSITTTRCLRAALLHATYASNERKPCPSSHINAAHLASTFW